MNPVSTLYHIAPCCFVFLFLPFTYIELPRIMNDPNVVINVPLLLGSAAIAFGEEGRGKGRSLQWPGSVPIPSLEDSPYNLPSSLPSPPPPPPAALNMAVFLLIGKTSALTMNIAGVVKDWMLIGLSVAMFG